MKKILFLALMSASLVRVAAASNGKAYAHGREKEGRVYSYGHNKNQTSSGATVPEINPGAAAMALALLIGGAFVLRGRKLD